jgi:signal transduction histidine kinase
MLHEDVSACILYFYEVLGLRWLQTLYTRTNMHVCLAYCCKLWHFRNMLLKFLTRFIACLVVAFCQMGYAEVLEQQNVLVAKTLIFTQVERIDIGLDGAFSEPVTIKLPDSWNTTGKFGRSNYVLAFDISNQLTAVPLAIYVPRLGNRVAVVLNGKKIAESAVFGDINADSAQRPFFLKLPAELLVTQNNRVELQLEGEKNRYAGLSKVHIGIESDIYSRYSQRYSLQTAGSFAVIVASIMFAIVSLLFWRVTKDKSYLLFSVLCVLWSIRTSYAVIMRAPFDHRTWTFLIDMCYAGVVSCIIFFCIHTLNLRFKKTLYAITGGFLVVSFVLVAWHALGEINAVRQWWTFLMLIFVAFMSIMVISAWYFDRQPGSAALAGAGAIALMLGAYDHITVFYFKDGYGGFALARYAILFFLMAMAWILSDRFLRLLSREKTLRSEVAEELRIKKMVLEKELLEKEVLLTQSAHDTQRRRLLQDLHDGMGLQLNGLMGLVEHGSLDRRELTSEVRTTLEQLRVMMDGTESFDGTLAELFGHVRYRAETRLLRHAIRLAWDCQLDDASLDKVNPSSALNMQRVMFELCTNIIKHAKASCVNVNIQLGKESGIPSELLLVIADDGIGIQPDGLKNLTNSDAITLGAGTLSVKRRVAELNANYEVISGVTGGMQHTLNIPISSFY